jgi:hypothetical protein
MKRQGYDIEQIAEAIEKASVPIPEGELSEPEFADSGLPTEEFEDYFAQ